MARSSMTLLGGVFNSLCEMRKGSAASLVPPRIRRSIVVIGERENFHGIEGVEKMCTRQLQSPPLPGINGDKDEVPRKTPYIPSRTQSKSGIQ